MSPGLKAVLKICVYLGFHIFRQNQKHFVTEILSTAVRKLVFYRDMRSKTLTCSRISKTEPKSKKGLPICFYLEFRIFRKTRNTPLLMSYSET